MGSTSATCSAARRGTHPPRRASSVWPCAGSRRGPWPRSFGTSHSCVRERNPLGRTAGCEEFISSTLVGYNGFTARSPRLRSVHSDGDRREADGPPGPGRATRSGDGASARPGIPGRRHRDPPAAPAAERASRIFGHLGAGPRLPASSGDAGAIYPPSTDVACSSPIQAAPSPPRRCLRLIKTWQSRTHRR